MWIQILSDLHLEFTPEELPPISSQADVLVYAGDVSSNVEEALNYFQDVRKSTKATIIYVMGNHEFYGKFLHSVGEYRKALRGVEDLHILDRDIIIRHGVKFVGCTLWTNFDDRRGEVEAQIGLADFDNIRKVGTYYGIENISTTDIIKEYRKCRDFLQVQLCRVAREEPVVVVTHHAPSFYCVPENRREDALNKAFYVEMSDLILAGEPVYWVYGHVHELNRTQIGKTEIICNPWGYPFETPKSLSPVLLEVPDA